MFILHEDVTCLCEYELIGKIAVNEIIDVEVKWILLNGVD